MRHIERFKILLKLICPASAKPLSFDAGNPQILGQKPITFFRQILSLVDYPDVRDLVITLNIEINLPPQILSAAST